MATANDVNHAVTTRALAVLGLVVREVLPLPDRTTGQPVHPSAGMDGIRAEDNLELLDQVETLVGTGEQLVSCFFRCFVPFTRCVLAMVLTPMNIQRQGMSA